MIWVESSHYLFCGASIVSLKKVESDQHAFSGAAAL